MLLAIVEPLVSVDPTKRKSKRVFLVAAAYLLFALVVMGPALTECGDTLMGGLGDPTSGAIWLAWQWEELNTGPWPAAETPYVSAPFGEPLFRPHFVTSELLLIPMWLLSNVIGPVCSWNVMVLLGFMTSGLLMYGLVRWLTSMTLPAAIAGFAYAFSPYHVLKAQGHLAYLHSACLVGIIWAVLYFWARPGPGRAALMGFVAALAWYVDGYYILIGSATFFGSLAVLFLASAFRKRGDLSRRALLTVFAGVVMAFSLAPVALIFVGSRAEIKGSIAEARSLDELAAYSARAHEYVLPPRNHPLLDEVFASYQDRHLHGSNYSEQTLYLGWTVILLAGVAIVRALQRRSDVTATPQGLSSELVVVSLAGLLLLMILLSAPPTVRIGSREVPLLSGLVFHVSQLWRVYARFFLAVHAAVVALAGVGLASVFRRRTGGRAAVIGMVLTILITFEYLTFPPRSTFSYLSAPPEYSWIAKNADVDTIVEYPILEPPIQDAFTYISYQRIHEKRLINPALQRTEGFSVREGIQGLADPQTLPALRTMGADLVVVHRDLLPKDPGPAPKGLTELRRFGDSTIYRIDPGAKAELVVGIESGFHAAEYTGWSSGRWMSSSGILRVDRLTGRSGRARVSFRVHSPERTHTIYVSQDGKELHRRSLTSGTVTFEAAVERPIAIRTDPPAHVPGTDTRLLSIFVTEMIAVPID